MHLTKNKLHQLFFYILITLILVFNGGNYDFFNQFNFIFVAILFLFCQRDINYRSHIKKFFLDHKKIIFFYFIFLIYIVFQIIPLPIEVLKFFSPIKYKILNDFDEIKFFSSISLEPLKTFFNLLNYFSLLIYFIIFKVIFYKEIHFLRLYFFLVLIGFISASVALYFFLIGNPDFYFISNRNYSSSATGFFINRTVFASFLNLCFLCGIEYLTLISQNTYKNKYFYTKIYIRLFLLFITIGIISSFSKIGNFLFFLLILIYLIKFLFDKNRNNYLIYTLIIIFIFDILILGIFFGGEKLLERFYFLKEELVAYTDTLNTYNSLKRADIARFSFYQFIQFKFFGYGAGSFEALFKVFNINNSIYYANHAHSDFIEFLGEFGLVGFVLLFYISLVLLKKINFKDFKSIYLIIYLIIILIFDFSFHIFLIQLIFSIIASVDRKKNI